MSRPNQKSLHRLTPTAVDSQLRLNQEILANMAEGVCLVRDADGVIVYTNPRFDDMLGYHAGELEGKHVGIVNAPGRESLHQVVQRTAAVLTRRGRWSGELQNRRKDGSVVWCSANTSTFHDPVHGRVWCVVCQARTARKSAEEALRKRTKHRLRLLERLSPVGIFQSDAEGRCTWVNNRWCELTHCTRDEAVGDGWLRIIHQDDREAFETEWRDAVRKHAPMVSEQRLARPGVPTPWVLVQRLPDVADDGTLLGHIGALTEITARKADEATLVERGRQLEAAVAEREVLLRELHHRVKNNLQVISCLLSLQLDQVTDRAIRTILTESQSRIGAMAAIHEHLYRRDDLRAVDMPSYLATVANTGLRLSRPPNVDIELSIQVAAVALSVDDAMLCGLIVNELLSNCGKHAFVGRDRGRVLVGLEMLGSEVVLKVSDDGVGLRPSFRLEECDSLGLQLAQNLTKQLGGEFSVEKGLSTTMVGRFPLR